MNKGEVRCGENSFNTLLFRYDWRGVWVYCRDCRDESGKRGQEHLVTWGRLFKLFLGLPDGGPLGPESNDQHGGCTGCNHNQAEG